MVLRCTARLIKLLDAGRAHLEAPAADDDWYAHVIWIEGRKCLQLMHSGTLFPVAVADVRVADLRPLGRFVTAAIRHALADERLPADALGRLDDGAVQVARTASRQLLGFMTDDAKLCQRVARLGGGIDRVDIDALNRQLRRTLHNRDGTYVTPLDLIHWQLTGQ